MEAFTSLYTHGFVRVASCVPRTKVADVCANLAETIRLAQQGDAVRAALLVFPELGLSCAIDDSPTSSSGLRCRMVPRFPRAVRCLRGVIGVRRRMQIRMSGLPSLPTTCPGNECQAGISAMSNIDRASTIVSAAARNPVGHCSPASWARVAGERSH